MQINDEKRIDILLNLLKERYEASHKMRERSLNFAVWILGFGIVMSWMLLHEIHLNLAQKIILTLFIIIMGFLTKIFLKSIEKGFNTNKEVMIQIEDALECYKESAYIQNRTLFPKEYKDLCRKETSHFDSLDKWLLTIGIVVVFFIWLGHILKALKSLFCK